MPTLVFASLLALIVVTAAVIAFRSGREDRKDAARRCPPAPPGGRVEVDLGGWGEPDWCVTYDADGDPVGERLPAK